MRALKIRIREEQNGIYETSLISIFICAKDPNYIILTCKKAFRVILNSSHTCE